MLFLLSCIITPGIGRLIREPAKYRPEVAHLSILRAAARFYSVTPEKLRGTGPSTGDPPVSLADRVAARVRELIVTGKLTDEKRAVRTFAREFDNELIAYARSGGGRGRSRTDRFYSEVFLKLGERDTKMKKVLRDTDARNLALMDALLAFVERIQSPDFELTKTARDYFFGIFKNCCRNRLTKMTKPVNRIRNRQDPDELIAQLPARGQLLFEDHEAMKITKQNIERFGKDHPDKLELLNLRSVRRWPYARLADHFGGKKGTIRVMVYRARKLFTEKYLGRS